MNELLRRIEEHINESERLMREDENARRHAFEVAQNNLDNLMTLWDTTRLDLV